LTVTGIAPTRIEGWGSLFAMPANET